MVLIIVSFMTYFFGVTHGGFKHFFGLREEITIYPTNEMIRRINEFPSKSRVGVEWFSPEDFGEICDNLSGLCEESGLEYVGFGSDGTYWDSLLSRLKSDLKIVFLEEKDIWLKINKAVVEKALNRSHEPEPKKDESVLAYRRRIISQDYDNHVAQINYERMHKIERNDKFLEVVGGEGLQIVVSGIGHTDYWWAHKEVISGKLGIVFEGYSTERLLDKGGCGFVEGAVPDPERVFSRIGLERSIRLVEDGRIMKDGEPQFVGTWSVIEPAKGYFEVYVGNNKGNKLSGRIEDCFGSATFEGEISQDELKFTKRYDWTKCVGDTYKTPILYKAKRFGDEFSGFWFHQFGGNAFYMIKKPKEHPIDLVLGWNSVMDNETNSSKVKTIKRD